MMSNDISFLRPIFANAFLFCGTASSRPNRFPHVLIENFVEASFLDRLMGEFPAFDREKAISELGTVGGKSVHQNLPELGEAYRELDGILRSEEFPGSSR